MCCFHFAPNRFVFGRGRLSWLVAICCLSPGVSAHGQERLQTGPPIAPGPLSVDIRSAEDEDVSVDGALVRLGGRFGASTKKGVVTFDGVPGGLWDMQIQHPDYEFFQRDVELSQGRRQRLSVLMNPVKRVAISGIVRRSDAEPFPGARVVLTPKDVRSPQKGRFEFTTNWKGEFRVMELPPGEYFADVTGFGSQATRVKLNVPAGEVEFSLKPISERVNVTVNVIDAASQLPISGAKVLIAEAWPAGVLAETATNAAGVAIFEDLAIGQLNWMDRESRVRIARRQCTVRVEASDYTSALVTGTLHPGADITVALDSNAVMRETESAGDGHAQPIRFGAPIELSIHPLKDVDVFSFRLRNSARVKITATSPPVDTVLKILGAALPRDIASYGRAGTDHVIDRGLPPGTYKLQIHEHYNDNASETPFRLRVEAMTAPDAFEPNDDVASARLLRPGEEVRGAILPVRDIDLFRFELRRAGTVRFSMQPHRLDRVLELLDRDGAAKTPAAYVIVRGGQELVLEAGLDAGEHLVSVREWYDDAETEEPYSLRFDLVEDDAFADPPEQPGRLSSVREQPLTGVTGGTIMRIGDRDRYALNIPRAGMLHVTLSAPFDSVVTIRDSHGKSMHPSSIGRAGQSLQIPWSAPGPMTAFLDITEWYDDNWSASPYILRTWWEPGDEYERAGRNDSRHAATPVDAGEVLRGSISPVGDVDLYRFDMDHPGFLHLNGSAPVDIEVRIFAGEPDGKPLSETIWRAGSTGQLGADVPAGEVFVKINEWYNDNHHVGSYEIETRVDRAEPMETKSLASDPVRSLNLSEARSFAIDQKKDLDRFQFSVPAAGQYNVSILAPLQVVATVFDDRTNERIWQGITTANVLYQRPVEAKGPTRYRVELNEWYDDARSAEPGHLLVDTEEQTLTVETITWSHDVTDPTLVTFSRSPVDGVRPAQRIGIDADGNGTVDLQIPPSGSAEYRYQSEGTFPAVAYLSGEGAPTVSRLWVRAVGPRERKGIWLNITQPPEDSIIVRDLLVKTQAVSYTGADVASVRLSANGRRLSSAFHRPFELGVPWRQLGPGEHQLTLTAIDRRGEQTTLSRSVSVSEYFDLKPQDGASVTGNSVSVSWSGGSFGPAAVRLRRQGSEDWKTVRGENSRHRRVVLQGLEAGTAYEFQPIGGRNPGPIRSVTRVKGLAFARPRYGAVIARDYDQRLGIAVRNHAEEPMTVRLECGRPADSRLLAGFVGEGSEGVPFDLKPGEQREFLLGLSAQDVLREKHTFAVRVVSGNGFSDEAEVEVSVRLPEVKLVWDELGDAPVGMGRRFRLRNAGDALTDLKVVCDSPDVRLSPEMEHGTLPRGGTLEVTAYPRLFDGFEGVKATLSASAINKTVTQPLDIQLEEGQKAFQINLTPGFETADRMDSEFHLLRRARMLIGAHLDPAEIDWSARQYPQDEDGDGDADRWYFADDDSGILWVGDDSDDDGQVDFVRADVGLDGKYEYSAILNDRGWKKTNLIEAWLEMGFRLPWARTSYENHDVDVVVNDTVVGRLRDEIPEGNYRFRLPPHVLNFGQDGTPGENRVAIKSSHLRGGHYVVNNDFRILLRMNGAKMWTVADSREDAEQSLRNGGDIVVDQPDFSISSSEIRIEPRDQLTQGKEVAIVIPIRNLGSRRTWMVPVALVKSQTGKADAELVRMMVEGVGLGEPLLLHIPWKLEAGKYRLNVVVDPDRETTDSRHQNNTATISMDVPGDDTPPNLEVPGLADNAVLQNAILDLAASATDDGRVALVEVCIDDGLWASLDSAGEEYSGKLLLQPGDHRIEIRAIDAAGNQTAKTLHCKVDVSAPTVQLLEPKDGAAVQTRSTDIKADVSDDVVMAGVRVNGGPWQAIKPDNGRVAASVELRFGRCEIEIVAVTGGGVAAFRKTHVQCEKQKEELSPNTPPAEYADGTVDIDGVGPVNLLHGSFNRVISESGDSRPVDETASGEAHHGTFTGWKLVSFKPNAPFAVPRFEADTSGPGIRPMAPCHGASVSVQRSKSDWYCTNRPEIQVPFRLPEDVMEMEIPDVNSPEYDTLVAELLERLTAMGIDTAPFIKYQQALLRRVRKLDHVTQLPEGWSGLLQWLGIATNVLEPPGQDPAELAAWRRGMEEKLKIFWVRLLATDDPKLISEGLQRRMRATQLFDEAVADEAQAIIENISAHQRLTQDVLETAPFVGEAMDLLAAGTGETLSGEKLSAMDRTMRALFVLGPMGLQAAWARGGKSVELADSLDDMADRLTDPSFRQQFLDAVNRGKSEANRLTEAHLGDVRRTLDDWFDLGRLPEGVGLGRNNGWEDYLIRRENGLDLDALARGPVTERLRQLGERVPAFGMMPVIDMRSPQGKFVSIVFNEGDSKLLDKFKNIFGMGKGGSESKVIKMLRYLNEGGQTVAGQRVTLENFLENAELLVPSRADAESLRKWISETDLTWLGNEIDGKNLRELLGSDEATVRRRLQEMIRGPESLPPGTIIPKRVGEAIGRANRRTLMRSPRRLGELMNVCD